MLILEKFTFKYSDITFKNIMFDSKAMQPSSHRLALQQFDYFTLWRQLCFFSLLFQATWLSFLSIPVFDEVNKVKMCKREY